MRFLAAISVVIGAWLPLGCSGPDHPNQTETNPAPNSEPAWRAVQLAAGGESATDAAAPLTDAELDRMLDALEHQIAKKSNGAQP